MSIYKKIRQQPENFQLSPDHPLPRAKRGAFFLSKLLYGFMSIVVFMLHGFGFLATTLSPPRNDIYRVVNFVYE